MAVRAGIITVLAVAAIPGVANAEFVAGARSFAPADFERFAPKTALDMVRQIPGFVIDEAEDRRGLGQGGGNVLLNGKRFSGKSNNAVDALGRIPASAVTRVDVVDAASLDIPGLSGEVVNVISEADAFSGQFRWSPEVRLRRTDPRLLDGELTVSGKTGGLDYSVSLENVSRRNGNAGYELVFDGDGNFTDRRYEALFVDEEHPRISTSLKYAADNGNIANLNLSYGGFDLRVAEDSDRIFADRDYLERKREWSYEAGGDYEFGLAGGRMKLIGLHRFTHSPSSRRVIFLPEDGSPDFGSRFKQTGDSTESIARGEYSWTAGSTDWQLSAEGAFNKLDVEAELANLSPDGIFVPVPLPGANAVVKEKRGEAAVSFSRPLAPSLTLQASLGGEYSQLRQSGENGLTRTFYRPKGYVSLAWKASPVLDIRARAERAVGQLDFFDFVASTDVSAGNSNAGNPNLVPEQSWKFELEATRNLGSFGSATARVFADFITDIVDQVPIGDDGEAPGNIDRATRYGIEWNSTFNLDPIGWRGARIDLDLAYRKSSLKDPLTGKSRRIGEEEIWRIIAGFRHDIPATDLAYGWNYEQYRWARFVRLGEIGRFNNSPGGLSAFLEHKDVIGMTVRGTVSNLLGTNEALTRTQYVGRRDGPAVFTESRSRYFGPIFTIDISGTF